MRSVVDRFHIYVNGEIADNLLVAQLPKRMDWALEGQSWQPKFGPGPKI